MWLPDARQTCRRLLRQSVLDQFLVVLAHESHKLFVHFAQNDELFKLGVVEESVALRQVSR